MLDALDISPESFRLAAAVVLALEGARALLLARPRTEPQLAGLGAALVPVAFPLLLSPAWSPWPWPRAGTTSSSRRSARSPSHSRSSSRCMLVPRTPRADGLLAAGGRLLGALEIAAGVALAVGAIHDV